MALPGPNPADSVVQQEKRLVDRAQFMGEAARTGKQVEGEEDGFEEMLAKKVKKQPGSLSQEEVEEQLEAQAEVTEELRQQKDRQATAEEAALKASELHSHNEKQTYKEAEKRGGWRGPASVVGLAVVGQTQLRATEVQAGKPSPRDEKSPQAEKVSPGKARVDPTLIQALRTSGLDEPLIGLNDPRLTGSSPLLGAPWKKFTLSGGAAFSWNSPLAHQRVELRDGNLLLESAGGTLVQTLERVGGQAFSRIERREPPKPQSFAVETSDDRPAAT